MEKQQKPFYKKWWFWVIVVIIIIGIGSGNEDSSSTPSNPDSKVSENTTSNENDKETINQKRYIFFTRRYIKQ